MINLIQEYLDGKTNDFYSVVGELEGALDAAEIKDRSIVKEWYKYWTPLETRRAVEGNNVTKSDAIRELSSMKEYLLTKIKQVRNAQ
jgi:L-rhamnose mutarotase